ncbi:hypothetical protein D3C76_1767750 [compost metagenome]
MVHEYQHPGVCHGLGGFELGVDSMHLSHDEECAAYDEGQKRVAELPVYVRRLCGSVESNVNKHECITASCFSVYNCLHL